MARFEIADLNAAGLGQAPMGADTFYELGMMYSIGRSVPADLVSAHKWFNLAAMKGNKDATRLRQEVAGQMSPAEIAAAQRAARAFLTMH
jgi:TPR repeat protein